MLLLLLLVPMRSTRFNADDDVVNRNGGIITRLVFTNEDFAVKC